jgi:hypothetical protein
MLVPLAKPHLEAVASPMAINLFYYPDRCIFPEYTVLALSILCQRAYAKESEFR